MKLYQYAIIHVPKKKDALEQPAAKMLVPVTTVLAEDDSQANIFAARAIPEEHLDKLDEIQLAIRPF